MAVLRSSRAARLLDKDPRDFGATVKRLYLSGSAGGVELRELLAYTESMVGHRPTGPRLRPLACVWRRDPHHRERCARCRRLTLRPGRAREGLPCACNKARSLP